MTATTYGAARADADSERRFPLAPAEGWTTVGLALLLGLTLAWSIDDASWVLGRRGLTDFLAWAIGLGVGWGFLSAKVGWSRWLAHLLGAITGALILSIIVGSVLVPEGAGPAEWFGATAASVADAFLDLTYRELPFTAQLGHFLLVLGLLCWATGQYAGYAVFHHRRPLNAVIVIGVGLVANMSLTIRDQLPYLVIYTLAAQFLLIRYHAHDERTLWIRHRIGDAAALGGLYLRGGSVFVAGAVIAALLLTAGASSAPLAGMWQGMDQRLVDLGRELTRVFRGSGRTRLVAVDFGASAPITGAWTTDGSPVLEIRVPDDGRYYWRAVAYDRFDGRSWSWSSPSETKVAPDDALLSGTADDPLDLEARRQVTFDVRELGLDPRAVFVPDAPVSVDIESTVTTVGAEALTHFSGVTAPGNAYRVSALVPIDGIADPITGLTANRLRVAGTDYPESVRRLYLELDPATFGPATKALLADIHARHPEAAANPYDLARAITTYLVSEGGFTYDTDVTDIDCGTDGIVECFARNRAGYCEYFASTMAVLLRLEGVPVRLAEGFLPGRRDASGTETILKSGSHAWVEVFFPGFGWVTFDPTGGGVGQDRPLPQGPVVTAAPASPQVSIAPGDTGEQRRSLRPTSFDPSGSAAGGTTGGPGSGPYLVVGFLLLIVVGALAFSAWQRGPRSAPEPNSVFRDVVRLARRFGFGPRASQTVFEYTSALGEVLPGARPDLQTVARAKVEVAYGRRQLGDDRLRSLRDAQRRLRLALFGLVFHRRERPGQRRR